MTATYTVKQVAEILGYSTNSIYTFLKENKINGVRVGKGRFRIPQSELNRLLLITKSQNGSEPMTGTLVNSEFFGTALHKAPPFTLIAFGKVHVMSANIFDWFISIASIVSGLALYLFNQTFDLVHIQSTMPILPAVRILLIGGGIGILFTNFVYGTHPTWHKIFHGVLGVAGLIMTVFLIAIGDIDAVGIYGTLTLVIILTMFVRLGRIIPFVLYLTLLAIVAPLIAFTAPGDFHVAALTSALHLAPLVTSTGLSIISLGFITLLWSGIYRNKAFIWFCSYAAAAVYFALAFWFANGQYWSRAFFFMIVALTAMYLPSWEDLTTSRNKRAHTSAIGILAAIMALILVGVTIVYVTQLNVISTVKRENIQKVDYASSMMETDIQSVKSTVTTASINPNLIAAVQSRSIQDLTDLSRIIFDSSDSIRRIVFIDKNGMAIFLYPLGTFDQIDLSFRDYFIQTRDTGSLYVSGVFESLVDNAHKQVVSVSAPLYTPDKEFVGVLAASLNLDAISARLQKIAVTDRGEYIVVLDSQGKRIMHPFPSLIGTDTEPGDPALQGLQGKTGVGEGDTYDGIHSLIAYTSINSLHWVIALKAPYNSIYGLSSEANVVVASLLIGCVFIAALIFQLSYIFGYKRENGGGP